MDLQITHTAQYGLEWRIVLTDRPDARRAEPAAEFWLPDENDCDDCPTQEAFVQPELKPRILQRGL